MRALEEHEGRSDKEEDRKEKCTGGNFAKRKKTKTEWFTQMPGVYVHIHPRAEGFSTLQLGEIQIHDEKKESKKKEKVKGHRQWTRSEE